LGALSFRQFPLKRNTGSRRLIFLGLRQIRLVLLLFRNEGLVTVRVHRESGHQPSFLSVSRRFGGEVDGRDPGGYLLFDHSKRKASAHRLVQLVTGVIRVLPERRVHQLLGFLEAPTVSIEHVLHQRLGLPRHLQRVLPDWLLLAGASSLLSELLSMSRSSGILLTNPCGVEERWDVLGSGPEVVVEVDLLKRDGLDPLRTDEGVVVVQLVLGEVQARIVPHQVSG